MDRKPYLVQRVELKKHFREGSTGVDALFGFDYMGSSEFEWGALPAALRAMREKLSDSWNPREIRIGQHAVWYVGPDELHKTAKEFFEDQLGPRKHRLKEASYIDRVFKPKDDYDRRKETIGWWCIDSGLEFAFFKTEDAAKKWVQCLKEKKA